MEFLKQLFNRYSVEKKWRVIYPDGKRTRKLCFDEANELRKIFGGKLKLDQ